MFLVQHVMLLIATKQKVALSLMGMPSLLQVFGHKLKYCRKRNKKTDSCCPEGQKRCEILCERWKLQLLLRFLVQSTLQSNRQDSLCRVYKNCSSLLLQEFNTVCQNIHLYTFRHTVAFMQCTLTLPLPTQMLHPSNHSSQTPDTQLLVWHESQ